MKSVVFTAVCFFVLFKAPPFLRTHPPTPPALQERGVTTTCDTIRAMDDPARLVFIGASGSGKTTVVNKVLASLLDEKRATRGTNPPNVQERETLTRSCPRPETMTMEARVREEYSDVCLSPEGRRDLAVVQAQADAVLPALPTLWNVEVRDAPQDADFHVRVTVTYAPEPELETLVAKARLAFGLPAGPKKHSTKTMRNDTSSDTDDADSSTSFPLGKNSKKAKASKKKTQQKKLTPLERDRACSILGCAVDDESLKAALTRRDRPYLPSRLRDFLGSTRSVDFRGPTLFQSLEAARVCVTRVCGTTTSRVGCLDVDTKCVVEVPLRRLGGVQTIFADTPGNVTQSPLSRKLLENCLTVTSSDETDATKKTYQRMDCLFVVSDGTRGPDFGTQQALRNTDTFGTMLGRHDGASFILLWPLDRLGQFDKRALDETNTAYGESTLAKVLEKTSVDAALETSEAAQSPFRGGGGFGTGDNDTKSLSTPQHSWLSLLDHAAEQLEHDVRGVVADGVKPWHGRVRGDDPGLQGETLMKVVETVATQAVTRRGVTTYLMQDNVSRTPVKQSQGIQLLGTKGAKGTMGANNKTTKGKGTGLVVSEIEKETKTQSEMTKNNPFAFESPSPSPRWAVSQVPEMSKVPAKRKQREISTEVVDRPKALQESFQPLKRKKTVRFAERLVESKEISGAEPASDQRFQKTPAAKTRRKPLLDISKVKGNSGGKGSVGKPTPKTTPVGVVATGRTPVPSWQGEDDKKVSPRQEILSGGGAKNQRGARKKKAFLR